MGPTWHGKSRSWSGLEDKPPSLQQRSYSHPQQRQGRSGCPNPDGEEPVKKTRKEQRNTRITVEIWVRVGGQQRALGRPFLTPFVALATSAARVLHSAERSRVVHPSENVQIDLQEFPRNNPPQTLLVGGFYKHKTTKTLIFPSFCPGGCGCGCPFFHLRCLTSPVL